MDIAVNAVIGALILLALGWLKADIGKLTDRIERMTSSVTNLAERVAHLEGRLDERERH